MRKQIVCVLDFGRRKERKEERKHWSLAVPCQGVPIRKRPLSRSGGLFHPIPHLLSIIWRWGSQLTRTQNLHLHHIQETQTWDERFIIIKDSIPGGKLFSLSRLITDRKSSAASPLPFSSLLFVMSHLDRILLTSANQQNQQNPSHAGRPSSIPKINHNLATSHHPLRMVAFSAL